MNLHRIIVFLVSLSIVSQAKTFVAGMVEDQTFDSLRSPYVITNSLFVPQGKSLTIQPGTILIFEPFTGINIYGSIFVNGTKERPVLFTIQNDPLLIKNNLKSTSLQQWNGISIQEKASLAQMGHFILRHSLSGITSVSSQIQINNGFFNNNVKYNVSINNQITSTKDSCFYSYPSSDKIFLAADTIPRMMDSLVQISKMKDSTLYSLKLLMQNLSKSVSKTKQTSDVFLYAGAFTTVVGIGLYGINYKKENKKELYTISSSICVSFGITTIIHHLYLGHMMKKYQQQLDTHIQTRKKLSTH